MNMYGCDKPDTRFEMTFHDLKTILKETEFNVLKSGLHEGGTIKAIVVKNHADISRKGIDKVLEIIKSHGGHGVLDLKFIDGAITGRITKFFSDAEMTGLQQELQLEEHDLVLIVSGEWETSCTALGAVRDHMAIEMGLIDPNRLNFLWVTEFPLLE